MKGFRPNNLDIVSISRSILAIVMSFHWAERDVVRLEEPFVHQSLNIQRADMDLRCVETEIHRLDMNILLGPMSIC